MKNAYVIKIQLIPTNKKYKSAMLSGIVFASDQATAVKIAIDKVTRVVGSGENQADFQPKLYSCVKQNAEFVLHKPERQNDTTNADNETPTT